MPLRDYDVVNNVTKFTLCFRCDGFHDVFTVIRMAKWKPSTDAALFSH